MPPGTWLRFQGVLWVEGGEEGRIWSLRSPSGIALIVLKVTCHEIFHFEAQGLLLEMKMKILQSCLGICSKRVAAKCQEACWARCLSNLGFQKPL